MALRFIDGADYYNTSQLLRKWDAISGGAVSAGNGRRSSAALLASGTNLYTKNFDAQGTWIVGFSIKTTNAPTEVGCRLLQIRDAGTEQISLRFDASGHYQITRNGTVLGTSVATLVGGVETYVEVKVVISDASGTYEVRVNGSSILSGSSADTKNTANATADSVQIGFTGSITPGVSYLDDIYICDGTGSSPHNTFLGDCRVDAYLPNADGSNSDFTCSTGSTHNTLVDENPANDDTDYVQSSTVNHRDSYGFTDMSHTPATIYGVQANLTAKKDDAGARTIAAMCKSSSTTSDGSTQSLSTSYTQFREMWATDPNTSAAWTKTNLNAAEFGIKVVA